MNDPKPTEKRVLQNHEKINEAVTDISNAAHTVSNLLQRITSSPANPNSPILANQAEPTLSDILETTPQKLHETAEQIKHTVLEIEKVLF